MIKNGRVEIGKTPSDKTGKPCKEIKEGEPLDDGEKPKKRIVKWAKMLDPDGLKKAKKRR